MYRSFTDRVFGGVCGGLGALLPLSSHMFRLLFIVLTVLSGGLLAGLYVLLWLMIPQESLANRQPRRSELFLLAVLLSVGMIVAWGISLNDPQGTFAQVLPMATLLMISIVFFLRQLRG